MNQDAIDQALCDEPEIIPSRHFSRRVMHSVRTEAAQRQALPFPWQLLAGSLVVIAGLTFAGALTGDMPAPTALAEPPAYLAPALAWLSITLAGSLALASWSVSFARRA